MRLLEAARRSDPRPLAVTVRAVPVLAGVVGVLTSGLASPVLIAAVLLLLVAAAAVPRTVMAGLAVAAVFLSRLLSAPHGTDLAPTRVIVFATALWVMHSSLAIGSAVPLNAGVEWRLLRRWWRRTASVVAVSAIFVAGRYAIGPVVSSDGLELAGLLATTAAVSVAVVLARATTITAGDVRRTSPIGHRPGSAAGAEPAEETTEDAALDR